ncbi:MAG TPA: deoxyribose-phosphate aldolase [Clostridiales bacterium]|nr:deoxyribose-phosphate aldolase [Clostridiales bacterium]
MDKAEILKKVDLSLLSPTATSSEILALCDKSIAFRTACVCIPPSYVPFAKQYLGDRTPICTVIGFPNGYNTTAAKCAEAEDAIKNGASEIDMMANLTYVKNRKYEILLDEIRRVKEVCKSQILKVIIETCLLTEREKKELCSIVSDAGADFIKTSTGFSTAGATVSDIVLMRKYCSPNLKIKAAGGIKTFYRAEIMLGSGADRIGASNLIDE